MQVAIVLFDGVTALDAVGPYEVLAAVPGSVVRFVAGETGPKRTDTGALALVADHALDEVPAPDVVLVPGGEGTRPLMRDREMLGWLREAHARSRWTTSVCTGALVLGAAGLLDGRRATTHWLFRDRLAEFGADAAPHRVVQDGRIITAAGVSAGIDMALALVEHEAGSEVAQAVALGIEYDPQPPLEAGSPEKAPQAVVEMVRRVAAERDEWLRARISD